MTAPIQDVETVDVVGRRADGGTDLVVVVTSCLEETEEHRGLVAAKLNGYLETIGLPAFQADLGPGPYRIVFRFAVAPAPAARAWLLGLAAAVRDHGAELVLEEDP